MFIKVVEFFKAPPDIDVSYSNTEIPSVYKRWRIRMFYSMFIAYVVFYMCRKNISIAMPGIQADLGYSYTELGFLGSTLYITYALGKFLNGVLADRANIRNYLTVGLALTSIVNVLFGLSSSLWVLILLWGLNGGIQSMGFPPIAKGLTHWFAQKERATKWSIWSTAHEVGTSIAIYLSGFILAYLGWRYVFLMPGIFTVMIVLFIWDRTRDTPKSIGLPSIEEFKNEPFIDEEATKNIEKESLKQTFMKHILPNKALWGLAFAYIFVYIIRYGTIDWLFVFFFEHKNYNETVSSGIIGLLPLFGILGTVGAGFFSDKLFKSRRMPLNALSMFILVVSILALMIVPKGYSYIEMILVSVIGIFTCIPQVLVGGVCAVESGSKKVASAATGFCGMFGYIGSTIVGPATGFLIDNYGWNQALISWAVCALIGFVICFLMISGENKRIIGNKV